MEHFHRLHTVKTLLFCQCAVWPSVRFLLNGNGSNKRPIQVASPSVVSFIRMNQFNLMVNFLYSWRIGNVYWMKLNLSIFFYKKRSHILMTIRLFFCAILTFSKNMYIFRGLKTLSSFSQIKSDVKKNLHSKATKVDV